MLTINARGVYLVQVSLLIIGQLDPEKEYQWALLGGL
jgi:hypothetical protein